jgi:hypothetical protein
MGQFKPMVKMKTTEPSVELKLKKGGSVAMAKGGCAPMRKGGMAEGGKSDMAQDKAMIKKAMKQHDMQEHKGGKGTSLKLRKGGMSCATGGVVNGQTGYKMGGSIPKSGIIKSEKGRSTMADGANPKQFKGPTGVVKKGAPAGFKTGGKSVKGCK